MDREMLKEQRNSGSSLAAEILKLARSELLVPLRFLDTALFRLKDVEGHPESYAVDGEHLRYNVRHVLISSREEKERVPRDLLHMLTHCLFAHPFRGGEVNQLCYDLACDIAAENVINELELTGLICKRQYRQDSVIETLRKKVRFLSAEKIYRYLTESDLSEEELCSMAEDFRADDHSSWYFPLSGETVDFSGTELPGKGGGRRALRGDEKAAVYWREAGHTVRMDMETFSREWGEKAGTLMQCLDLVLKEKVDYRSFLKRFAISGESLKVNEDEFDYCFYTYGLQLYGNMPLIEPLEYREEKKIRDFVIAIDTSASVSGKLVRRFLEQTCQILLEKTSFFEKVRVHILQCDTEIQEDAVITSREDFEGYLEGMELKGFGGTDFRPVFAYVNGLVEKHHFESLKGLLYFTDGYGEYPLKKPPYETAFIFLEDTPAQKNVPPWAMKAVLDGDEVWML
ncbi:MAG: VWA-like domain-containing protein [Clostridia bacterium]